MGLSILSRLDGFRNGPLVWDGVFTGAGIESELNREMVLALARRGVDVYPIDRATASQKDKDPESLPESVAAMFDKHLPTRPSAYVAVGAFTPLGGSGSSRLWLRWPDRRGSEGTQPSFGDALDLDRFAVGVDASLFGLPGHIKKERPRNFRFTYHAVPGDVAAGVVIESFISEFTEADGVSLTVYDEASPWEGRLSADGQPDVYVSNRPVHDTQLSYLMRESSCVIVADSSLSGQRLVLRALATATPVIAPKLACRAAADWIGGLDFPEDDNPVGALAQKMKDAFLQWETWNAAALAFGYRVLGEFSWDALAGKIMNHIARIPSITEASIQITVRAGEGISDGEFLSQNPGFFATTTRVGNNDHSTVAPAGWTLRLNPGERLSDEDQCSLESTVAGINAPVAALTEVVGVDEDGLLTIIGASDRLFRQGAEERRFPGSSGLTGIILPLTVVMSDSGDSERFAALSKAARLEPQQWLALGLDSAAKGDYERALHSFQQGWLNGGWIRPTCLRNLVICLWKLGRLTEAHAVLKDGIVGFPHYPDLAYLGAAMLLAEGDYGRALTHIDGALSAGGTERWFLGQPGAGTYRAYRLKGHILERLGKHDDSLTSLVQSLHDNPWHYPALGDIVGQHLQDGSGVLALNRALHFIDRRDPRSLQILADVPGIAG